MSLVTCFQFSSQNAKYLGHSLLNEKLCTFGFTKHSTLGRSVLLEIDYIFVGEWMKRAVSCVAAKGSEQFVIACG